MTGPKTAAPKWVHPTPPATLPSTGKQTLLHEAQVQERPSTDPPLETSNSKWASQPLKIAKLKIGSLNVGSLTGKAQRMEDMMDRLGIDLLFVSETWTVEGQAKRFCPSIVHALEHKRTHIHGHVPYGQAILLNKNRCQSEDFAVLEDDPSEDRSFSVVQFRGIVFVCLYAAPSRSREWFTQKLESCATRGLTDHPTIVMGDLNARHISFGDHISNTYGNILISDMDAYGLQRMVPSQGKWTFVKANARSIVDHVLLNDSANETARNLVVHEDLYVGGAEHRLITFEVDAVAEPRSVPAAPRPWNRLRLKEPAIQEALDAHCQRGLPKLMDTLDDLSNGSDHAAIVNEMDALIQSWLNDALKAQVGLAPLRRPGWASTYMTRDLIVSEQVVEHHFDRWSAAKHDPLRSLRLFTTYEAHRKSHLKLVAERKGSMYAEFAEKVGQMNATEQVRLVASMRKNKSRSTGALLRTDRASLGTYGAHFASQFINIQPAVEPLKHKPEIAVPNHGLEHFPYVAICEAIQRLANGKASGISGIPAEVLKAAGQTVAEPLHTMFSFCLKHKVVPTSWCRARIHPVPKKGDLSSIANYRPISLTEVPRKLFESLLLPVVKAYAEPLAVEQGGFRAARGTLDQIATLQEWICQSKAAKAERYMAFLDIKAAYDQVDRAILWQSCRAKRIPEDVISMLQALFDRNRARVAVNGQESEEFPISSGVLQGSLLSPLLYSVFIDDLADALNASGVKCGVTIGGRPYRLLLYADDIVLLANSKAGLRKMLTVCEKHSADKRYRFNVAKCEVVASAPGSFEIYSQPLPRSDSFVYLGCPFAKDGIDWEGHFKRMGAKALTAADSLNQSGVNGRGLGVSVALSVFRTFIRPVLEYGLALCPQGKIEKLKPSYGRTLSWLSSSGKGASPDVIGLFGALEPLHARWERLNYRFINRVAELPTRSGVFAVVDAFQSHNTKRTPASVFSTKERNPICKARSLAINSARFSGVPKPKDNSDEVWKLRKEELMQQVPLHYHTGFIFGALDIDSRLPAKKAFSSLSPLSQHSILLWCLNRATGHWKICRGCRVLEGTKDHVEACILHTRGAPVGPSHLEDRLFESMTDAAGLEQIARDIIRCIGERPDS